jgi:signal transduction histidine kinase
MQDQLNLINRISDELNKDLDPDKMLRRVLNLTVSHLNASTGSIMLFDDENRVSDFILQQEDLSAERAKRIVGTVLTEGFAGWMLKHGRGDVIYDTHEDKRWVVYDNQPYDVRSVVGSPLLRRQRVLGVLTVVRNEPDHFTEIDLSLITAIAGQAAIALENAYLFKETEQERRKLSAIINSTQDAVLVTTPENKIVLLNPAAQEILNLNGKSWQDAPLTTLTHNKYLLNLFAPNAPSTGEVPLPDRRTMWASVTEIPELGRVTVLRDISAFKALDRLKRDFVTAFTHDLRTPLATVKGYVELVRMDGPVTDRQEEDLVGVTRAANMMKSLIEDLLQLSRLERLEELVREKLHLEETVETSVNSMRALARTKEIDFAWEERQTDLVVEGNPVLLSRAVDNLLDNAIKYTPQGGKVRIKMSRVNTQALISVIDNGPGINAKDLPRVFEKFFRARPELDDIPGTGLGLAIVKTIVEQHGGQVGVESQPNLGSTFTITLPLAPNGNH